MTKCAIYVRVSTDKQEVDNQLYQLREYANNKGWEIHNEFVDIISGKQKKRPGFDLMLQEAYKRKFQVLLFWDLSRFSRAGILYTLQVLKELENNGVEWESYQEQYFRSAGDFKDVVISIMAQLAKIEREKISERTKAGLERAKREGKKLGRKPVSNYHKRRVRELHSQGWSKSKISKELRVGYGTVWRILSNEDPPENDTVFD